MLNSNETVALTPSIQHCWVAEVSSGAVAQRRGCTRCVRNGHSPGIAQDAREVGVSPGEMVSAEDSAYVRLDSVTELPVYVWSVSGSLLFGSPLRRARGVKQLHLPSRDPTWVVFVEI